MAPVKYRAPDTSSHVKGTTAVKKPSVSKKWKNGIQAVRPIPVNNTEKELENVIDN